MIAKNVKTFDFSKDEQAISKSEEETRELAERLSEFAKPGMVIALNGDLGAGKTTFVKYFAKALGVRDTLSSPTFTVVREYTSGRMPLYHFDVYRVHDEEDLFEIGFYEYIDSKEGICLIEWANLIEELLPEKTLRIDILQGGTENERVFKIKLGGHNL